MVSRGGYPLAYDIFKGNQFEGHTMLPIIESFKTKYKLDKLIVVADAGLLSKDNIKLLEEGEYEYILGARIKAVDKSLKEKILNSSLTNGESAVIAIDEKTNLIITYSEQRARKDAYNRERGLLKLEKQIKTGKLTKASINNRGYNKFLDIQNEVKIIVNKQKISDDKKWDGLKGYVTNTTIYHRVQRRIEAHISIAFVAYKIYKELERQLKMKQTELSAEKAIDIAKTIYAVKVVHPISKDITYATIITSEEQKNLAKMFNF